ncbi:MAG: NADH-quinone oxidoreductase subunit NuoK [Actinomycetaceae bacterium]|nr:NADH-quinone oxidoreductase subunit NuoK [Actinomycetaceae bacterium]
MSLTHYVVLAGILFFIGAVIVLTRHSAAISLMGVELMLNSCNLVLVTFSNIHKNMDGQVMAFFIMVVAAAEVVVGLAIVVSIFKSRRTTSLDDVSLLRH